MLKVDLNKKLSNLDRSYLWEIISYYYKNNPKKVKLSHNFKYKIRDIIVLSLSHSLFRYPVESTTSEEPTFKYAIISEETVGIGRQSRVKSILGMVVINPKTQLAQVERASAEKVMKVFYLNFHLYESFKEIYAVELQLLSKLYKAEEVLFRKLSLTEEEIKPRKKIKENVPEAHNYKFAYCNRAYLIMDRAPGTDLLAHRSTLFKLESIEVMDRIHIMSICFKMCLALEAFHELGYIHFDIKPEHFIYDRKTHTLKIIDFGFATPFNPKNGLVLQPCLSRGTYPYVAPETLLEKGSKKSDYFSLAIVIYEYCEGKRLPNEYLTSKEIREKIHIDSGLPFKLRQVLAKYIHDYDRRPSSLEPLKNYLTQKLTFMVGQIIREVIKKIPPSQAINYYERLINNTKINEIKLNFQLIINKLEKNEMNCLTALQSVKNAISSLSESLKDSLKMSMKSIDLIITYLEPIRANSDPTPNSGCAAKSKLTL